ncbi:hypothetical protein [Mucilaginibacter sp. PAMB04168]|uniref:hypothetical protein n=1 Tax=Mucilaginibacter sp. PAMB04168 TaxID=3138567 RepID=UPI0031F62947
MKQAFIYSLKVWLPALIIAPLITVSINWFIAWYNPINYYRSSGFWVDVYFNFVAGAALIPLAALFWLATLAFVKTQARISLIKLQLTLVATILCVVPFAIFGKNNQLSLETVFSTTYWLPSYLMVAVPSIWICKLAR